jgi:hypothetical protein
MNEEKPISDWKKMLADILKRLGLIKDEFSGKIEIEMNDGGVRNAKRTEHLT